MVTSTTWKGEPSETTRLSTTSTACTLALPPARCASTLAITPEPQPTSRMARAVRNRSPPTIAAIFRALRTRSEEPTSELQSLMRISYAVFCMTKTTTHPHHNHYLFYITYT